MTYFKTFYDSFLWYKPTIISKLLWTLLLFSSLQYALMPHAAAQCFNNYKINDTNGGLTSGLMDNDYFGAEVAAIGDLDGDGIEDMMVSSIYANYGTSTFTQMVHILFLNTDGTVKAEQRIGETQGGFNGVLEDDDNFGEGLAYLGDLDGDGIGDIAVGSFGDDDGGNLRGAVYILFLHADGTVKAEQKISSTHGGLSGLSDGDVFGTSITNLGDLDGDGVVDIVVGAPYDDDGGNAKGAVHVLFLNMDGTVKAQQKISDLQGGFNGFTADDNERFGFAVASIGDIDGDGVVDMAVGVTFDDDGGHHVLSSDFGAVYILFLNTDGTVKAEQKISALEGNFNGPLKSHNDFGHAITSIGDLNGDGIGDIAVSVLRDDEAGGPGSHQGAVYVLLLNADGTVKAEQKISGATSDFNGVLDDYDRFGSSLTTLELGISDKQLIIGTSSDDDGGSNRGAVYVVNLSYNAVEEKIEVSGFCPPDIVNTISPSNNTYCSNGVIDPINGVAFDLVGRSPYFDGLEIGIFQWQVSYDGTTWQDIVGATTADMTQPVSAATDLDFRRVYTDECCGAISISNEVTVTAQLEAPTISILPLHYCPGAGESEQIIVEVAGGQGPFTYAWSPATGLSATNVLEPTVTFGSEDFYTLQITGGDGCVSQEATAVMIPIQADAGGSTTSVCNDEGVSIGRSAIPGLGGVSYSWIPTTGLSCSDCPDPIANPTTTTTYTLTVDDGNGCVNSSSIQVLADAYQADTGSDVYVCRGTDPVIGTPSQPDIFYGWAPGLYIDNQTIAQPTFFSGVIPDPNPYTYTLTTFDQNNGGCQSVDTLLAHVPWADAGLDDTTTVCNSPDQIGTPDCCNGQATYTWTVVSGDANSFYDPVTETFSNTSNIPEPFVMPTTQLTTYQVEVTWGPNPDNSGGASCTDLRFIEPSCGVGGCPVIDASFENDVACGIGTSGTIMRIPLSSAYWDFAWTSPDGTGNLSCTDCPNPTLINDVTTDITYTLNYTSKINGSTCSFDVDVFDSATATPTPLAQGGVACSPSNSVNIGNAPIAGWQYEWTPNYSLDDATSSNPSALPLQTTDYTLEVKDVVTSCKSDTTITVVVINMPGVTGGSVTVCSGESVVIGSLAKAGYTYSWSPTAGLSDPNIAQPTATVTSNTSYALTVSASNGCSYSETMTITTVNSFPVDAPDVSICSGGSTRLSATVMDVNSNDLIYNWSPATNLSSTTVASPVVSGISSTTNYSVTVTSSGGGCIGTTTLTANVVDLPQATLSDVDVCNNPVAIGTTLVTGNTYSWSPTTDLSDASIADPTSSATATTTYTLQITTPEGCSNEFDQTVNVLAPEIEAGNDLTICEGNSVSIGIFPAQAGATYSWSPTTGLTNPNTAQTIAEPTSTTTYTLTASMGGCTSIDAVTITVNPAPDNIEPLSPFAIICRDNCQEIGISPVVGYTYQWLPVDAVSSPNSATTEICPTENVALSLRVTDPNSGCSITQDMSIFITTGGDCPVLCTPPTFSASTIPATCAGIATGTDDAMLEIMTAADATHYNYVMGSDYSTGQADIVDATAFDINSDLPLRFGNLLNPIGSQHYTIRVFNGASDCFADIVLTLSETTNCCPPKLCIPIIVTKNAND